MRSVIQVGGVHETRFCRVADQRKLSRGVGNQLHLGTHRHEFRLPQRIRDVAVVLVSPSYRTGCPSRQALIPIRIRSSIKCLLLLKWLTEAYHATLE
jgi:hypothetical protein